MHTMWVKSRINNKPLQQQLYKKNQKCLSLNWMHSFEDNLRCKIFVFFVPPLLLRSDFIRNFVYSLDFLAWILRHIHLSCAPVSIYTFFLSQVRSKLRWFLLLNRFSSSLLFSQLTFIDVPLFLPIWIYYVFNTFDIFVLLFTRLNQSTN